MKITAIRKTFKNTEHLAETIILSGRIMGMAMIIAALIVGSSILILAPTASPASPA